VGTKGENKKMRKNIMDEGRKSGKKVLKIWHYG